MNVAISLLGFTLLTQAPISPEEPKAPAAAETTTAEASRPVGRGRIQGGWEYVWASYGIAAGALSLYGFSLWRRTQTAKREGKETP